MAKTQAISRFLSFVTIVMLAVSPVLFAGDGEFKEDLELIAEISGNSIVVDETVKPGPGVGKIAYVYEDEKGFKVCMNTDCGPYVERVARNMPVVSPNGQYVAAVVQKTTGDDVRVMLGNGISKPYDMVYALGFSPDSMKLTYISQADEVFSVYVNQGRQQAFSLIDINQGIAFSRDSENLAYVASKDGKSWHLVKNGETGEAFEQIKHVTFSPDSDRLAYAAKKDGKWHLVEGENKGPGYVDIKRIRFSLDSERLVYVARSNDGEFVVLDGEKSEIFELVPGEPVFSPSGDRLAYTVAEEKRDDIRMRMVVDGEIGPAFHRIGAYRFSPDGEQFAYQAVKDDETGMVVLDGEFHKAYETIGVPVFSPEGRHLAFYVFHEGQWHVIKDGERGPAFDDVEPPIFCPKGKRMVYVARKGEDYMVIEDGEIVGDTYELAAMPAFSPDGKHLAYTAIQNGESFLVVNGKNGGERFLSFLKGSPLVFIDNNTVQGIAVRAFVDGRQEFWLIRAKIEK